MKNLETSPCVWHCPGTIFSSVYLAIFANTGTIISGGQRESTRIYIEWPRVVNVINADGGDPLCTLHRGEGVYIWVRCRGYMRDSSLKT